MGQSVQEALDALLTATTPDTYLKSLLDASDEPSRTDAGQDGVVVSNNGESSGEVGKSTQQDVPTVETPSQPVPSDDISIPILHCHLPQPIMKQYQSLLQYLMAMSKQKKELSIYKELLDINKWVQQQLGQPQEEMAMVVFSQKKLDFQRLTLSSNHTGTTNSANATSVPATNTGATASASQASSSKATAITATSKVEEKAGAILQTLTNFLEDYINYLWDVENEGNQVDALEAAEELQQALKKLPYTELCLKEWDAKVAKMAAEEAEREISDDEKNVSDEVHNIADALEMKLAHFCFEKSIKVMKGMVHKVAQHHLIQVPTLAMDTLPFLVELEDHVDEVMSVDSTRGAINAVDNEKQKASKAYISQLISQTQMPQPQQPQSQFGKAKAKGKINAITTVTANAANKSNKNVTAVTTAPSVSSSVAPLPLPFPNQAKPIDTTAAASGAAQKTVSGGKIAPSTSITPLPVPIFPSTQSPTRVSTKPSIETTPLAVATRRTPLLPKSIEPYPQGEVDVNVGMLYFHEEDDEDILVDVKTSFTPSAKTKETVDTADDDSLTIVMMSANKKRSQPSSANRVVVGSGGGNEHTFTIVENNEEMNSPSQKKLKV